MHVIVPLAGPDFDRADGTTKAEILVSGVPLLRSTLERRPWWKAEQRMSFVLRDTPTSKRFAQETLQRWYPEATISFLSRYTKGAALSALGALTVLERFDEVLCVDLADIQFNATFDAQVAFADPQRGAHVLTFTSNDPRYSYIERAQGRIVGAVEKQVRSSEASAGVYFFRSAAVYLRALAHSLEHPEQVAHRGLFFVCPLVVGVLSCGLSVGATEVADVVDIKDQGEAD